jgi:hypothetical protein
VLTKVVTLLVCFSAAVKGRTYRREDEFAFDITDAEFWWVKNGKAIRATLG